MAAVAVTFTRVPRSSMRSKTTKRRGLRCSLRRYQIEFLSSDGAGETPEVRPAGFAFADGEIGKALQSLGRRKAPFCDYVIHARSHRLQIVGLPSSEEAMAAAARARRAREDAEWDAAAPKAAQ